MAKRKTRFRFTKPKKGAKEGRGDITRRKIIAAAKKVFSEHPYHSASIRMIGKQGGFEYPLVHYYFPTKADLFKTVVIQCCDEVYEANITWFEGIELMSADEGLSVYLDRFLDYHFANPEPLRIIMLNMTQAEGQDYPPGYHHLPEILDATRKTFEERIDLKATPEEIGMYYISCITLLFSYLGSRSSWARVMGMEPDEPRYRDWVKETLMFLYLPGLRKFIYGD